MSGDSRGWRIALVPDTLVNPPQQVRASLPDVLGVLDASGYGLLQLPPPGDHRLLLAATADQVAEYAHHGYAVVAIGLSSEAGDGLHWRRLSPLLRHRGVALPPRYFVRPNADPVLEAQRLTKLLNEYDLPAEEQKRWRV